MPPAGGFRRPSAAIAACAVGLRIALIAHWDTYGALQLPLVFEAGRAAAIAVTTASPFGEPERVTGRWLPFLRLATALALTAAAIGRAGRRRAPARTWPAAPWTCCATWPG